MKEKTWVLHTLTPVETNYVPLAKTYLVKSDQSLLRGDNSKTSVGGGFRIFFGTVVIGTESKLIEPPTKGV